MQRKITILMKFQQRFAKSEHLIKILRNPTKICRIPEIHFTNLVDLETDLDAKIGGDTAENEL